MRARGRLVVVAVVAAAGACDVPTTLSSGSTAAAVTRSNALTIGAPQPVDVPVLGESFFGVDYPALTCNATKCLAAWIRNRAPATAYGVFVALDGTLLEPLARPFALGGFDTAFDNLQGGPIVVASNGTDFYAAWASLTPGLGASVGTRIRASDGARIDAAAHADGGQLLGGPYPAALASDGTDYAFVQGQTSGIPLIATRIRAATGVPEQLAILSSSTAWQGASVAFDGARYLFTWTDARDPQQAWIHGMRVLPDGTVLDGAPGTGGFQISRADANALTRTIYGGGVFLTCWTSFASNQTSCRRVGTDGSLPDGPASSPATVVDTSSQRWQPHISYETPNFLLMGEIGAPRSIWGKRVRGTDGALVDTTPLVTLSQDDGAAISPAGASHLLAWRHLPFQGTTDLGQVRAGRIRPTDGAFLDGPLGHLASIAENTEGFPQIAGNGTDLFVVWVDTRNTPDGSPGTGSIFGARIDGRTGATLDAMAIPISTAPGSHTGATASFSGTHYVIAWRTVDYSTGAYDVRIARVDATTGQLLDGTPNDDGVKVASSSGGVVGTVGLSCDSVRCLVVWNSGSSAARFSVADGRILAPAPIATGLSSPLMNAVATDGVNFVVGGAAPNGATAVQRVRSSDGVVLDGANGIAVDPGVAETGALSFDGQSFLFVWSAGHTLRRTRISSGGAVLDGPSGGGGVVTGSGTWPRAAFDGKSSIVVFMNDSQGVSAASVSAAGSLLEGPTPIVPPALGSAFFGIAAGPLGRSFLTYSQLRAAPDFEERVYVRAIDDDLGTACGSVADCPSGSCVDGVCCDTPCGGGVLDDCQACAVALGGARDGVCGPIRTGRTCRSPADTCHVDATCDGVAVVCPANPAASDGQPCDGGACSGGACVPPDAGVEGGSDGGGDAGGDARAPDAGADTGVNVPDAGPEEDAAESPEPSGSSDASGDGAEAADASGAGGDVGGGGCSCRSSSAAPSADAALLALVACFARARRRARSTRRAP